ncbi:tyrosine-type recombinase/integrase [Mesorhizobium sp. LHD-90]|uniref:tyrosine-type recombinase/integrase n=1 Tax=Mesorhizobium sp. LHD-90 TaxID=3071414 RepID=UPI0027E1479B|nr:tyrosine-type recombinase/integrase [Mesorhizobium sp. LHD-90]MDQ6434572.1 tyrosine-type recombinase/integrase [Mesorhizobium sp. LHD-90]
MPVAHLDETFAKRVARPDKGCIDYHDDKIRGFQARVYRDRIVGCFRGRALGSTKLGRLPLGEHPIITMAQMRKEAEKARGRIVSGGDPVGEREAVKEERRRKEAEVVLTFDKACDLFLVDLAKEKASWEQDAGFLKREARPLWGDRALADISKADVAQRLLEKAQVAPISANRLRSTFLRFFAWAVAQALIDRDPMAGIKKPTNERKLRKKKGIRVLDDAEFVVLWRAIEKADLVTGVRAALQTLALTGQRPAEIAGLATAELRYIDKPGQALIELPEERMKARRRHVTPLSRQAADIILAAIEAQQQEQARDFGRNSPLEYVFESRYYNRKQIARHSLSQAMRRVIGDLDPNGEDGEVVKRLQARRPTPHSFRRTCTTGMARLGVPREDRIAVLGHADEDVESEHYNAYDRLPEKRVALDAWARHVERLLSGEQATGEVVAFRRQKASA